MSSVFSGSSDDSVLVDVSFLHNGRADVVSKEHRSDCGDNRRRFEGPDVSRWEEIPAARFKEVEEECGRNLAKEANDDAVVMSVAEAMQKGVAASLRRTRGVPNGKICLRRISTKR